MKAKKTEWKMSQRNRKGEIVNAYDATQAYIIQLNKKVFVPDVVNNVCHSTSLISRTNWDCYGGGMINRWEWLE